MSSQDNEPDTRQRTVAELLAQYGGGGNGDKPASGRRRRIDDRPDDRADGRADAQADNGAPQAIIDRGRGNDNGATPTAGQQPGTTTHHGELPLEPPQPQAPRTRTPRPGTVAQNGGPQNGTAPHGALQAGHAGPNSTGYRAVPNQPNGDQPRPRPVPSRRPQPDVDKQPTTLLPPVPLADAQRGAPKPPVNGAPGGLSARLSGVDDTHTEQFATVDPAAGDPDGQSGLFTHEDPADTAFHQPFTDEDDDDRDLAADDGDPAPTTRSRRGGRNGKNAAASRPRRISDLPADDEDDRDNRADNRTDNRADPRDRDDRADYDDRRKRRARREDDYEDRDADEYDDRDRVREDRRRKRRGTGADDLDDLDDPRDRPREDRRRSRRDDYDDDYDDRDGDRRRSRRRADDLDEDELHDEHESTSGREWLTLVALVAAGVIGGAAVWLGFDYLWGQTKLIAAVAAIVVTVLVVIGVRSIGKVRDVQTTVFAAVVGLVVTASPAVLLLFGK